MIGQVFAHYRIVAKLGEGGMGVVYQAQDTKLERPAALKFLLPHSLDSEEDRQRFQREACAAAALNHPSICTIYEIVEDRGMTFIAMELVEGQTLKDRLAAGPLPVEEALAVARQIATGLDKAHAKGIVHRDIKPANIMITPGGRAKLMDFGLARPADAARITRTGATTGTLAYMSPEQIRNENVDPRTDLWSLGVVLYEMLTGRPAFSGEHEAAVVYQITNSDPAPPSEQVPDLPAAAERVVVTALSRDREQRYQSATELLDGIAQTGGGSGSVSRGPGDPLRRAPRSRLLATLALVGVLAILTAAVTFWYVNRQTPAALEAAALAIIDFQEVEEGSDQNTRIGLTELVNIGLIEDSPIRLVSPEFLHDLRRRLFGPGDGPIAEDQALEIARRAGASLLLSGRLARMADNQYVTWRLVDTGTGQSLAGRRVAGSDWIQLADGIIAGVLPVLRERSGSGEDRPPQPVSNFTSDSPRAIRHFIAGVIADKNIQPQQALAELQQATAIDTTFALAYFQMSRVYGNIFGGTGDITHTRLFAEKAWANRDHLGIRDRLRLEAWLARVDIQHAEARDILQEILARWPDDREALHDYAELLYIHWFFREALATAERGVTLYPDDLDFLTFQLECLTFFGRFDEALPIGRRCIELEPGREVLWQRLAATWLQMAQPDSAEAAARRALAVNPGFALAQISLGHCAYLRGDLEGAIVQLEEINARNNIFAGTKIRVLTSSSFRPSLSMLYAEAGRLAESQACFDRALELTEDPINRATIDGRRYRALLRLGRADEVIAWADSLDDSDHASVWFSSRMNLVTALALVDSLAASRAVVPELLQREGTIGRLARFMARKGEVEINLASGEPDNALLIIDEIWRDGLPRGGMFSIDVREAEIRALRAAGRPAEAAAALSELLRLHGGHAVAHYQLGQVYQQMGRNRQAAREYEIFLRMWAGADDGLPQVDDARRRLERLRTLQ